MGPADGRGMDSMDYKASGARGAADLAGAAPETMLGADLAGAAPEEILGALDALWRGAAPLLGAPLGAEERRRLGGCTFENDFLLVRAVAAALRGAAGLGLPDGAALREQQARADAYRQVRDQLLYLARCANDGFLREQGAAAHQAMAVLRTLRRLALGVDERAGAARRMLAPLLRLRERIAGKRPGWRGSLPA